MSNPSVNPPTTSNSNNIGSAPPKVDAAPVRFERNTFKETQYPGHAFKGLENPGSLASFFIKPSPVSAVSPMESLPKSKPESNIMFVVTPSTTPGTNVSNTKTSPTSQKPLVSLSSTPAIPKSKSTTPLDSVKATTEQQTSTPSIEASFQFNFGNVPEQKSAEIALNSLKQGEGQQLSTPSNIASTNKDSANGKKAEKPAFQKLFAFDVPVSSPISQPTAAESISSDSVKEANMQKPSLPSGSTVASFPRVDATDGQSKVESQPLLSTNPTPELKTATESPPSVSVKEVAGQQTSESSPQSDSTEVEPAVDQSLVDKALAVFKGESKVEVLETEQKAQDIPKAVKPIKSYLVGVSRALAKLYHSDGNITLLAEERAFRVHRGVLINHCEEFVRILREEGNRTESAPEILDGCSVIRLSDKKEDIETFLGVIYAYKNIYTLHPDKVISILGLATKYKATSWHEASIAYLTRYFPISLQIWDSDAYQLPGGLLTYFPTLVEANAKALLPAAYYLLCKLPEDQVEKSKLNPKILLTYHRGSRRLLREFPQFIDEQYTEVFTDKVSIVEVPLPDRDAAPEVATNCCCDAEWRSFFNALWRKIGMRQASEVTDADPLEALRTLSRTCKKDFTGCKNCHQKLRTSIAAYRTRIWMSLPEVFGLGPSWESLTVPEVVVSVMLRPKA
ncbi:hypothetical protein M422DRAFT_34206 [Sphaerobolus stellatus SS14]|uniref:BTB domain-containing protein n=1 Tax=Sphaerobolus stellatus (strain SS14) TaxID=990650 RepID=A0A0C9U1J1_SPHS4|nr:hypothetical protein M422DRAFT_34206 [Sphaerobolus stellatus SS14]